jgi:hypothetical protein
MLHGRSSIINISRWPISIAREKFKKLVSRLHDWDNASTFSEEDKSDGSKGLLPKKTHITDFYLELPSKIIKN